MHLTLNLPKLSISFKFLHKDTLLFYYLSLVINDYPIVKFFNAGYNKRVYAGMLFKKVILNTLKR